MSFELSSGGFTWNHYHQQAQNVVRQYDGTSPSNTFGAEPNGALEFFETTSLINDQNLDFINFNRILNFTSTNRNNSYSPQDVGNAFAAADNPLYVVDALIKDMPESQQTAIRNGFIARAERSGLAASLGDGTASREEIDFLAQELQEFPARANIPPSVLTQGFSNFRSAIRREPLTPFNADPRIASAQNSLVESEGTLVASHDEAIPVPVSTAQRQSARSVEGTREQARVLFRDSNRADFLNNGNVVDGHLEFQEVLKLSEQVGVTHFWDIGNLVQETSGSSDPQDFTREALHAALSLADNPAILADYLPETVPPEHRERIREEIRSRVAGSGITGFGNGTASAAEIEYVGNLIQTMDAGLFNYPGARFGDITVAAQRYAASVQSGNTPSQIQTAER